jgi:hypothetical protein
MAQLKMLKIPRKPKLPKKPKETASLASKNAYIRKVKEIAAKYREAVRATEAENKKRQRVNEESRKASKVIAGINGVEVFSKGFTTRNVRLPRPGSKIAGTKKRKTATKRKAAPKRKTAKRRR